MSSISQQIVEKKKKEKMIIVLLLQCIYIFRFCCAQPSSAPIIFGMPREELRELFVDLIGLRENVFQGELDNNCDEFPDLEGDIFACDTVRPLSDRVSLLLTVAFQDERLEDVRLTDESNNADHPIILNARFWFVIFSIGRLCMTFLLADCLCLSEIHVHDFFVLFFASCWRLQATPWTTERSKPHL